MFVAWLPPGTTVPASYDKDPFVLGVRKLRGVESNGMLASPAELGIGDDHDGILELTDGDLPSHESRVTSHELEPGMDFAEVFGLNDTIIDIENKMFTHRPDCFGQLGVAREIAGILGHRFTSPEWYGSSSHESRVTSHEVEALKLHVFNNALEEVPRFMAVVVRNVTVRPSPFWLQCELVRLGGKPINNVVDVTNYVMLLTAQPTHAYDYDKLRPGVIPSEVEGSRQVQQPAGSFDSASGSAQDDSVPALGVRMAKDGEKLSLLNGKTYELTADDIVIVDGQGPVGLGGVMGGGNSEVSATTKNIVLECATFDMYAVRKTSMRHGLFTDAVTRFNKGQSPLQNPAVVGYALDLFGSICGGQVASPVFDESSHESRVSILEVTSTFINDRLGLNLAVENICTLLQNVEFETETRDSRLVTRVPFWRTDIELSEDIVEEVGRLYGFDKLPHELPRRSIQPAPKNPNLEMQRNVGRLLSGAGANEVKTYSFVHERVLKAAGQDPTQAFRLGNALSPDLQYYRLSLTPSLLAHVHSNSKAGHDQFALYEFGKAHNKKEYDDEGLPKEVSALAYVIAAKKPGDGAAYYQAKRTLDRLLEQSGIATLTWEPLVSASLYQNPWLEQMTAPYEPSRSAVLRASDDSLGQTKGLIWGVVGEYKPAVAKAFKLPEYTAGFELDPLMFTWAQGRTYQPLSRFPHVTQDISLKVPVATPYVELFASAEAMLSELRSDQLSLRLSPLGIYQAEGSETKTITLRLTASNYQRTLTDAEVTTYLDKVANATASSCHAERA
jgi:phenylalanyl-tRNA synthetase beta chain